MALRVGRHARKRRQQQRLQEIDQQHYQPDGTRRRLGAGVPVAAQRTLAAVLRENTRWLPVVTRGEQHRLDAVARNQAPDRPLMTPGQEQRAPAPR